LFSVLIKHFKLSTFEEDEETAEDEKGSRPPRKKLRIQQLLISSEVEDMDVSLRNVENGSIKGNSVEDLIDRSQFIRLIIQALNEFGYYEACEILEKESGIQLYSAPIAAFCTGILEGNWKSVEEHVSDLHLEDEDNIANVKFLIYEQKYLELLECKKVKDALETLRHEITPLNREPSKLHKLSSFMMCSNLEDLKRRANWDGSNGSSRKQLLANLRKYVPPSILPPESRLKKLLLQAVRFQESNCLYHNVTEEILSLYEDHACDPTQIPTETHQILEKHTDEVWYIKFSHNGKLLASASKDSTVIIWEVTADQVRFSKILSGHTAATAFVSWSPDDRMLLSCGNDNLVKLWDVESGICVQSFSKHTQSVTSCAWFPGGKHFASASVDRSVIIMDLEGNELRRWTTARVNDLIVNKKGTMMITICQDKKITVYDLEEFVAGISERNTNLTSINVPEESMQDSESITSMDLSSDGKQLLVNVSSHEIHLWDLSQKIIVQKFRGQNQSRFVIRSCFGGTNEAFICSGSEDSNVYIWNRQHGTLLTVLSGHSGTVNTVSWNPKDPYMLASCSDDRTIRIWKRAVSTKRTNKLNL